jgi:hypothetical protein
MNAIWGSITSTPIWDSSAKNHTTSRVSISAVGIYYHLASMDSYARRPTASAVAGLDSYARRPRPTASAPIWDPYAGRFIASAVTSAWVGSM